MMMEEVTKSPHLVTMMAGMDNYIPLWPLKAFVYSVHSFILINIFEFSSCFADPDLGLVWNFRFISPMCSYCTGEGNLLLTLLFGYACTKNSHSYRGHTHTGVGDGFYILPSTLHCNMHTLLLLNFLFQNHPT